MTVEEFNAHFNGPLADEDDMEKAEKIDSPQHRSPKETSGYTGEVTEADELGEALALQQRQDWQFKGGIRYRLDDKIFVRAYFWKIR